MNVRCRCGACNFKTPTPKPARLFHCHCSECRRQSSSAFGTSAIFPAFQLPVDSQPINIWSRPTLTGMTMFAYFCKLCGSTLVHARKGDPEVEKWVSVKGGVIDALDWTNAEHIWCEDKVVNMEIPKEAIQFPQEPDD